MARHSGKNFWAFVPHYILPQLIWFTQPDYTHVSYVDLKPKVTDVDILRLKGPVGLRSLTPTATGCIHPGWMGHDPHSRIAIRRQLRVLCCRSGTSNGGPPLSVTAKFDGVTTDDAHLLQWVHRAGYYQSRGGFVRCYQRYYSSTLGLTTGYPTVTRMSPRGYEKNRS